ncbi:unnamed protein product [Brassica oleracea var. botrytis]
MGRFVVQKNNLSIAGLSTFVLVNREHYKKKIHIATLKFIRTL